MSELIYDCVCAYFFYLVIRKLQDFESPFISLKSANAVDSATSSHWIVLRKWYALIKFYTFVKLPVSCRHCKKPTRLNLHGNDSSLQFIK